MPNCGGGIDIGALGVTALLAQRQQRLLVQDDRGNTALHTAAQEGTAAAAEVLLAHRADPHVCNNRGAQPLRLAVTKQHSQVIYLLAARELAHADIGKLPVGQWAARSMHEDVHDVTNAKMTRQLMECQRDDTALIAAVQRHDAFLCALLIAAGANVHACRRNKPLVDVLLTAEPSAAVSKPSSPRAFGALGVLDAGTEQPGCWCGQHQPRKSLSVAVQADASSRSAAERQPCLCACLDELHDDRAYHTADCAVLASSLDTGCATGAVVISRVGSVALGEVQEHTIGLQLLLAETVGRAVAEGAACHVLVARRQQHLRAFERVLLVRCPSSSCPLTLSAHDLSDKHRAPVVYAMCADRAMLPAGFEHTHFGTSTDRTRPGAGWRTV